MNLNSITEYCILQELTTVKQHLHLQSELMDIQMLGFVIFILKKYLMCIKTAFIVLTEYSNSNIVKYSNFKISAWYFNII